MGTTAASWQLPTTPPAAVRKPSAKPPRNSGGVARPVVLTVPAKWSSTAVSNPQATMGNVCLWASTCGGSSIKGADQAVQRDPYERKKKKCTKDGERRGVTSPRWPEDGTGDAADVRQKGVKKAGVRRGNQRGLL